MVIICRDIGYIVLALFYLENLMGDFQYKMFIFYKSERGYLPPSAFFCIPPFSFYFLELNSNCVFCQVRKYKNPEVLVIGKDMDVVSMDMQPCMDALVHKCGSWWSSLLGYPCCLMCRRHEASPLWSSVVVVRLQSFLGSWKMTLWETR